MRNKGFLLIEVMVTVMVLAVGIVAVMQAYAMERRTAAANAALTEETFLLADGLNRLLAGVPLAPGPQEREARRIIVDKKSVTDEKLSLDAVTLSCGGAAPSSRGRVEVTTYIARDDKKKTY
jgi:type II secretory pathway pseudopilin PulG